MSKGVVVDIKPDHEMPYIETSAGKIYADVVMDPAAVTSRMNPGRIYEQYFCGMSRKTQFEMRKILNFKPVENCKDNEIQEAFNMLLGLLQLIGTEQYTEYSSLVDMNLIREIVKECVEEEVYILYRVTSEKRPYQIVLESKGTIYEPEINNVHINVNGEDVVTKDKVLIAPIYTIILDKTGEQFLSTSSSRINHFSIPVSINTSNKYSYPWKNSAVRVCSETETRLYTSYAGSKFTSELLDRASNIETHKIIYKKLLEAEQPTNIDVLIDRNRVDTGSIAAMNIIENLINSAGLDIIEIDESERKFVEKK